MRRVQGVGTIQGFKPSRMDLNPKACGMPFSYQTRLPQQGEWRDRLARGSVAPGIPDPRPRTCFLNSPLLS